MRSEMPYIVNVTIVFKNVFLFLQELLLLSKLRIQFIDKTLQWCLHTRSDLPFFTLFWIISILQERAMLGIVQFWERNTKVYTESKIISY